MEHNDVIEIFTSDEDDLPIDNDEGNSMPELEQFAPLDTHKNTASQDRMGGDSDSTESDDESARHSEAHIDNDDADITDSDDELARPSEARQAAAQPTDTPPTPTPKRRRVIVPTLVFRVNPSATKTAVENNRHCLSPAIPDTTPPRISTDEQQNKEYDAVATSIAASSPEVYLPERSLTLDQQDFVYFAYRQKDPDTIVDQLARALIITKQDVGFLKKLPGLKDICGHLDVSLTTRWTKKTLISAVWSRQATFLVNYSVIPSRLPDKMMQPSDNDLEWKAQADQSKATTDENCLRVALLAVMQSIIEDTTYKLTLLGLQAALKRVTDWCVEQRYIPRHADVLAFYSRLQLGSEPAIVWDQTYKLIADVIEKVAQPGSGTDSEPMDNLKAAHRGNVMRWYLGGRAEGGVLPPFMEAIWRACDTQYANDHAAGEKTLEYAKITALDQVVKSLVSQQAPQVEEKEDKVEKGSAAGTADVAGKEEADKKEWLAYCLALSARNNSFYEIGGPADPDNLDVRVTRAPKHTQAHPAVQLVIDKLRADGLLLCCHGAMWDDTQAMWRRAMSIGGDMRHWDQLFKRVHELTVSSGGEEKDQAAPTDAEKTKTLEAIHGILAELKTGLQVTQTTKQKRTARGNAYTDISTLYAKSTSSFPGKAQIAHILQMWLQLHVPGLAADAIDSFFGRLGTDVAQAACDLAVARALSAHFLVAMEDAQAAGRKDATEDSVLDGDVVPASGGEEARNKLLTEVIRLCEQFGAALPTQESIAARFHMHSTLSADSLTFLTRSLALRQLGSAAAYLLDLTKEQSNKPNDAKTQRQRKRASANNILVPSTPPAAITEQKWLETVGIPWTPEQKAWAGTDFHTRGAEVRGALLNISDLNQSNFPVEQARLMPPDRVIKWTVMFNTPGFNKTVATQAWSLIKNAQDELACILVQSVCNTPQELSSKKLTEDQRASLCASGIRAALAEAGLPATHYRWVEWIFDGVGGGTLESGPLLKPATDGNALDARNSTEHLLVTPKQAFGAWFAEAGQRLGSTLRRMLSAIQAGTTTDPLQLMRSQPFRKCIRRIVATSKSVGFVYPLRAELHGTLADAVDAAASEYGWTKALRVVVEQAAELLVEDAGDRVENNFLQLEWQEVAAVLSTKPDQSTMGDALAYWKEQVPLRIAAVNEKAILYDWPPVPTVCRLVQAGKVPIGNVLELTRALVLDNLMEKWEELFDVASTVGLDNEAPGSAILLKFQQKTTTGMEKWLETILERRGQEMGSLPSAPTPHELEHILLASGTCAKVPLADRQSLVLLLCRGLHVLDQRQDEENENKKTDTVAKQLEFGCLSLPHDRFAGGGSLRWLERLVSNNDGGAAAPKSSAVDAGALYTLQKDTWEQPIAFLRGLAVGQIGAPRVHVFFAMCTRLGLGTPDEFLLGWVCAQTHLRDSIQQAQYIELLEFSTAQQWSWLWSMSIALWGTNTADAETAVDRVRIECVARSLPLPGYRVLRWLEAKNKTLAENVNWKRNLRWALLAAHWQSADGLALYDTKLIPKAQLKVETRADRRRRLGDRRCPSPKECTEMRKYCKIKKITWRRWATTNEMNASEATLDKAVAAGVTQDEKDEQVARTLAEGHWKNNEPLLWAASIDSEIKQKALLSWSRFFSPAAQVPFEWDVKTINPGELPPVSNPLSLYWDPKGI